MSWKNALQNHPAAKNAKRAAEEQAAWEALRASREQALEAVRRAEEAKREQEEAKKAQDEARAASCLRSRRRKGMSVKEVLGF